MIEVGIKTTAFMTYEEAIVYCFCLGDGWRLPTHEEYHNYIPTYLGVSWYKDAFTNSTMTSRVIPVRDLKDD